MDPHKIVMLLMLLVVACFSETTGAIRGGVRSDETAVDGDEERTDNIKKPRHLQSIPYCTGRGGGCRCATASDGQAITMNRFYGDNNDEKVWGCGGAFRLSGFEWDAQMNGAISSSFGVNFVQDLSAEGWEGCCWICGASLQVLGKLSDGWYCEKDLFSTGIWLKGRNK